MNWKLMKLGVLLTQSKVPSEIPDANRRIRVKLNVGGVEKRPVSNDIEGATNYYIRKAGQFIFGTQNFHKGAFGIIPPELDGFETSNDIPSFDVSEACLPEWIFFYFKVGDRYRELEKLARGVGSKRVHPKQIFELVIPVPPVVKQLEIIEQVQASATRQRMIVEESDQQLTHLTHLRQALLREAMQGQLLPQDPTDEPAAMLLKKLQAAKAATGKGGKGKAGALFAEEAEAVEGPSVIPASWEWCTLGDICYKITDGFHNTPAKLNSGIPYIAATHVKTGKIDWANCHYVAEDLHKELYVKTKPQKGEILVVNIGAGSGTPAIIDVDYEFSFKNTAILKFDQSLVSNQYLFYFFVLSKERIYEDLTKGGLQPFLSLKILNSIILPLPPSAEQHRIVAKLEQLMQHCDALEQRIRESRRLAEQLLATALREALAPPAGTEPAEEAEPELVEVEATSTASRRGRPLKKRLAANEPDLFSELTNVLSVE